MDRQLFFEDTDGDGFGTDESFTQGCAAPEVCCTEWNCDDSNELTYFGAVKYVMEKTTIAILRLTKAVRKIGISTLMETVLEATAISFRTVHSQLAMLKITLIVMTQGQKTILMK